LQKEKRGEKMKVLVVYAHPNPQSFNHAVLEAFTKGLKERGHTFEVVDLYAIKFDPCIKLAQVLCWVGNHRGQRHKDVLEQQEKVAGADALAFIYPVRGWGFPPILKGWVLRVLSYGFAYKRSEKGFEGLLKHKKALLINTTDASEKFCRASGVEDAMKKIIVDLTLKPCGIQNIEHVFLYGMRRTDDETRKKYLETAYRLGKEF